MQQRLLQLKGWLLPSPLPLSLSFFRMLRKERGCYIPCRKHLLNMAQCSVDIARRVSLCPRQNCWRKSPGQRATKLRRRLQGIYVAAQVIIRSYRQLRMRAKLENEVKYG